MKEIAYVCTICEKEMTVPQGGKIPVCCGLPMAPKLDSCTKPFDAETARANASDEPCDDGTNGGN